MTAVVPGVRLACALIALVLVTGCDSGREAAAGGTAHEDARRAYAVEIPSGWHRAGERLSRISDPRELFTLATFRTRWLKTNCEAFAGAAGHEMGRTDVVVTVWERRHGGGASSDFPPRPARFGPARPEESTACGEPRGTVIHWRNFTDAGRHFHSLVRVGPDAPPGAREDAWRTLDSLRFEPRG